MKERAMYEYRAEILRVIDGDTVVARIDLGFSVSIEQHLRLHGINAPEIRGEERPQGLESKAALEKLIEEHQPIMVRTFKDRTGKYGRYIAELMGSDRISINSALVSLGHAKYVHY